MIRKTAPIATTVAACLALGAAGPASAAIVTGSWTVDSVDIVDLYSATFDGSLVNNSPTVEQGCAASADPQQCAFFQGDAPAGRAITITPTGTGSGSFSADYDDTTGEIVTVRSLDLSLPFLVLNIGGSTLVTVDPALGPNQTFIRAGLAAPSASVDPDQAPAIGQAGVFQHSGTDAPDFATFTDVVDDCAGSLCALIPILSLDGIRYRLEGTVNANGGDSFVLKAQTANNSIYTTNFTTSATVIPLPAGGWLLLTAVAGLGGCRLIGGGRRSTRTAV